MIQKIYVFMFLAEIDVFKQIKPKIRLRSKSIGGTNR